MKGQRPHACAYICMHACQHARTHPHPPTQTHYGWMDASSLLTHKRTHTHACALARTYLQATAPTHPRPFLLPHPHNSNPPCDIWRAWVSSRHVLTRSLDPQSRWGILPKGPSCSLWVCTHMKVLTCSPSAAHSPQCLQNRCQPPVFVCSRSSIQAEQHKFNWFDSTRSTVVGHCSTAVPLLFTSHDLLPPYQAGDAPNHCCLCNMTWTWLALAGCC